MTADLRNSSCTASLLEDHAHRALVSLVSAKSLQDFRESTNAWFAQRVQREKKEAQGGRTEAQSGNERIRRRPETLRGPAVEACATGLGQLGGVRSRVEQLAGHSRHRKGPARGDSRQLAESAKRGEGQAHREEVGEELECSRPLFVQEREGALAYDGRLGPRVPAGEVVDPVPESAVHGTRRGLVLFLVDESRDLLSPRGRAEGEHVRTAELVLDVALRDEEHAQVFETAGIGRHLDHLAGDALDKVGRRKGRDELGLA